MRAPFMPVALTFATPCDSLRLLATPCDLLATLPLQLLVQLQLLIGSRLSLGTCERGCTDVHAYGHECAAAGTDNAREWIVGVHA